MFSTVEGGNPSYVVGPGALRNSIAIRQKEGQPVFSFFFSFFFSFLQTGPLDLSQVVIVELLPVKF